MKGPRKLPYLLLAALLTALVFIGGVRYGKRVEQVNKTVTYLLSIPPTRPPITPSPPKYLSYSNKTCGVTFLYPSYLKPAGESTASASLRQDSSTALQFSCDKTGETAKILTDDKIATAEITFKNRRIKGRQQDRTYFFQTVNPYKGKTVYFAVDENLLPLLDSSLQYSP